MSEHAGDPVLPDRDIVSARTFDAPRERVFEAFVDPDRLACWWGPEGFTSTFHEFDPRPGGRWRFTMHGPGGLEISNESVFLELARPERIVLRHVSADHPYELTMTFAPEGRARTRVTWRMRHATAAECERVRPYVVAGNEQNFDRLAGELEREG
jgi:uncharacterized protein YndB with AHSA1/START domain